MPNILRLARLGALLLAATPTIAHAQGLPFNTPTALPLGLAENAVRSFYRHVEIATLLRNGDVVNDVLDRRLGIDMVPLVVPYGVTPKITLFAGIPYVWRTFETGDTEETNNGFGDAFILIKQELLARNFRGGTTRLAIFGGSSFPTGETEDDREPLPPPLRLGAGVVDLSGMAVLTHVGGRIGITGMTGYTAATASHGGVRRGDRFQYGLALGYRLFPAVYQSISDKTWVAYLEFNGTVAAPATQGGTLLEDTGGHTVFISPGIQFIPTPNLLFEATFQVPLVRELRGEQLAPDWSLAIGGRFLMFFLGR